jgi:cysteine desulfurase family protein (TIGR01976 family)
MKDLDLDFARSQFPAFGEPSLQGFAHFENAGGSYACRQVIGRLERFYRENRLQPYYPSAPSTRGGELMDAARARLAQWLGIDSGELHFGPSTSANTYVLAQALRQKLEAGDEVVVTNQDHEANIGAWARLAEAGIVVREWRVDPSSGQLDRADLEQLLNQRTRAVAFTHCSNVVGSIHPVRELTDLVHDAGARAIVDGVAFCPHGLPDLAELGADVYLFSLYKVYGPHLGVLYMRADLNSELPNQGHFFNAARPLARFTPAGPDHPQIAATAGVADYLDAVASHHGLDATPGMQERRAGVRALFRQHEARLLQPLLDFLAAHPRVRLIGPAIAAERAPTVAFTIDGWHPRDMAARLARMGLGLGAGHFYAYRLIEALGIDVEQGVLRASLVHYTSEQEVERLIQALEAAISATGD